MKNKSVLYTWALEFAVLLALMVCMCLVLTLSARNKMLGEYQQITELQQEKIEAELTNSFSQLRARSIELAGNGAVQSFSYLSAPGTPDNYTVYMIQNLLNTSANNGLAVNETYLYFKNIEKAVTKETVYEKSGLLLRLFGQDDAQTQQLFYEMTEKASLNRVTLYDGPDGLQVYMSTNVPVLGTARAAVIQQLDLKALRETIASQARLSEAVTLLMAGDGTVICQNGDAQAAQQLAAQYGQLDGSGRQTVGGQTYWVRSQPLDMEDWVLATMVPMQVISRKSDWVWKQSLVFLAVFLLVGVLLSVYLVRRNYRPVQQIVRTLDPEHGAAHGNEYDQIGVAFSAARSELEDLKLMQQKQQVALRREWLENVMQYDMALADEDAESALNQLGIRPSGEWFVLLALQDGGGIGAEEMLGLLLPLDSGQEIVPVYPHGKAMLCLFASTQQGAASLADATVAVLRQSGLDVQQGTVQRGFSHLHLEFLAMCSRLEQEQAAPTGEPRLARRILLPDDGSIARQVFSGQGEAACRALADVVALNFEGKRFSVHLGRMLYTEVLVQLLNAVPEGGSCEEVQRAVIESSRALQKAVSQTEMQELMQTLLLAVAAHYPSAPKERQADLLTRIMQCLQAHFTEHDFNVSRMADMLGVSVAYLSKYFKEHTGVNLLGYLNGIRIDYAKKLMMEEHLTVTAAADRAGFENTNTFIRLFKKYVGDTPGNYAKH